MLTNKAAEAKLKEFELLCRRHAIPLTFQRRVILETLASRTDHPTADQIYDTVKGLVKGLSRTTVYRVLDTFVRVGIAIKVSNPEAKARFDADTTRHHHLICLTCNAVIDCRCELADGMELPAEALNGFIVKDLSLSITGYCGSCTAEQNAQVEMALPALT